MKLTAQAVHALYHAHKRIRRVVSVAFFFEIVGMISGLVLALPGIQYDNICLNTHAPGTLVIYMSVLLFMYQGALGWKTTSYPTPSNTHP